ncbi:hypothetical protein TCAL_00309 [Tigriopus californicus]|uniref:Uncharacterized protein n=1 Tax=Tigriopus californicus TaxID=6832 RepID=A0A553P2D6_TIGCA|nr:uncharacterized protein LOC131883966 [Tigriopus californicus]TRY71843.1 hypothetical protein TCAL_00309 [Tigriopus californicus]
MDLYRLHVIPLEAEDSSNGHSLGGAANQEPDAKSPVHIRIVVSSLTDQPLHKPLFRYLTLITYDAEGVILPQKSFETYLNERQAILSKPSTIQMQIVLENGGPNDVMVDCRFAGDSIYGSPHVLSLRHNASFHENHIQNVLQSLKDQIGARTDAHTDTRADPNGHDLVSAIDSDALSNPVWTDVEAMDPQDVTRTGKSTRDLDASDIKSMGYDGGDDSIYPNNEQLSTVREVPEIESTSPQRLMRPGGFPATERFPHSPMVTKNLPLNVPSPHTTVPATPKMGTIATDIPANAAFTPKEVSTVSNLARQLGELRHSIPNFPEIDTGTAVEDSETGSSILDRGHEVDIERFQKNLSGEDGGGQPQGNPAEDMTPFEEKEERFVNKSVSFHPETTVFQMSQESRQKGGHDQTVMNVVGSNGRANMTVMTYDSDKAFDEYEHDRVEIVKARTKEADGELSLAKSLIDHQNSSHDGTMNVTDRTEESYDDLLTGEEEIEDWAQAYGIFIPRVQTFEKTDHPNQSVDSWNTSRVPVRKPLTPEFDLSSKRTGLGLFKSFVIPGVPQSVAPLRGNRLLVTDVENSKIWSIDCISSETEDWASEIDFDGPRYIIALSIHRVVVLDNKYIYVFRSDGQLIRKIFEGEAHRFRGLTYYQEYGRLVTSETTASGIQIVFIDVEKTRDIVHVIKIDVPDLDLKNSKVRYLSCAKGYLYASDLGLGQVYVIRLKDQHFQVIKSHFEGSNRLKQASGLDVDPAGNILVGSMAHGKLQLLKPNGKFAKTFQPSILGSPGGVLIHGGGICVIDCKKKLLHMFLATEI